MKIIIAEHAGFCFGVKRAVHMAEEAARKGKIYSIGPLIHNKQETTRLKQCGISTFSEEKRNQSVLIRTHGVGPQYYADLEKKGHTIIDATCPHVRKAQMAAKEAQEQGYQIIILGDKKHAEVQGIQAWTGNNAYIIASIKELEDIVELTDNVAVLAQTTEKKEKFAELVDYLQQKVTNLHVLSTICTATQIRQAAAASLALEVEMMIVIGGRHSSNTTKLVEICTTKVPTYLIEEAEELQPCWFQDKLTVGITAGASTPDWIIKEVVNRMEEINRQGQEEIMNKTQKETGETVQEISDLNEQIIIQNYQPGDIIKGTVVKISGDEVLVDIRSKSEGIIPANEFPNHKLDSREQFKLGEEILVEVLNEDKDGNIILSRKSALFTEAMDKLQKAKETGEIIEAPVIEIVKGGLLVDIGIRGFVPASQVERSFVKDFQPYLHKTLRLKVIELDEEKRKAVLSQRVILEEEYQKQRAELWEKIEEGETRTGVVKKIVNFGAFVDIGGIDGLLHVTELGWGRVNHPSDVLQEGDQIEVYVLKVDKEKENVSLSLKQLLEDPWKVAIKKYPLNSIVKGKVMRIMPFGAFVELEPGVEGLVHISKISEKRISRVEEVLSVEQEIDVKIIEVDSEKKRISLSIRDISTDKEKAEYTAYLEQQSPQDTSVTIGELLKKNQDDIIKESQDKTTQEE